MSQSLRLLLSLVLAAWFAGPISAQYLRVYYPDIEQGSSTLVVSPTGTALLIDAGSGIKSVDEGVENFINDLVDAGIVTNLEFLVATHYDEDHIGRMENVFQLVPLPANCIAYDRGDLGGTPGTFAFGDYSFAAGVKCTRTTVPVCTVIDLGGGVTAKVITVNGEVCGGPNVSPFNGSELEENAASVALLVTYGDFDIWIGGDLTGNPTFGLPNVEEPAGPQTGDVDVYTLNHHGSQSSSIQPFLDDLKAEVGINQSSIENSFGHPTSVVVRPLPRHPRHQRQHPGLHPAESGQARRHPGPTTAWPTSSSTVTTPPSSTPPACRRRSRCSRTEPATASTAAICRPRPSRPTPAPARLATIRRRSAR